MKLTFRLFFLCCVLVSYSPITLATSETEISESERLYLHPKSIKLTEKGIAVTRNGQEHYIPQLNVDKDGRIYTSKYPWAFCRTHKKYYMIGTKCPDCPK